MEGERELERARQGDQRLDYAILVSKVLRILGPDVNNCCQSKISQLREAFTEVDG